MPSDCPSRSPIPSIAYKDIAKFIRDYAILLLVHWSGLSGAVGKSLGYLHHRFISSLTLWSCLSSSQGPGSRSLSDGNVVPCSPFLLMKWLHTCFPKRVNVLIANKFDILNSEQHLTDLLKTLWHECISKIYYIGRKKVSKTLSSRY